MEKMKTRDLGKELNKLLKNKYMLCVLLAGAVLLLLPGGEKGEGKAETVKTDIEVPSFSLAEQEKKLEQLIALIDGAGDTAVMLSIKSGVSRELAEDEGSQLVLSVGNGVQSTVPLRYGYPEYQGAVVVCDGADNARVKLAVNQAVAAVTGLGSDRITIVKMK